jgi:hypothetical protein
LALICMRTVDVRSANSFPQGFIDEQGEFQLLPRLRLVCDILVGKEPQAPGPAGRARYDPTTDRRQNFPALLDTGAPLTVFPRHAWEAFEDQITWLRLNPDEVAARPPDQRTPTTSVFGSRFPYRLGRVWIGAFDREGRLLPAVPVIAQFRDDVVQPGQPLPLLLLGLWGGILEGRRLERHHSLERDDPQPPHPPIHGQRWWLRDY